MSILQNTQTPSPTTREQALQWLVRLQSGEATAGDRRHFKSWILDQPTHREEFLRFSIIWNTLDQTKPFVSVEIGQAEVFWNANRSTRLPGNRLSLLRWGTIPVVVGSIVAFIALTTPVVGRIILDGNAVSNGQRRTTITDPRGWVGNHDEH